MISKKLSVIAITVCCVLIWTSTTFAGGGVVKIVEQNPGTKILHSGVEDQLLMEFTIDPFEEYSGALTLKEVGVACDDGSGLIQASLSQGSTVLSEGDFVPEISDYAAALDVDDFVIPAEGETHFTIKVDVAEIAGDYMTICRLSSLAVVAEKTEKLWTLDGVIMEFAAESAPVYVIDLLVEKDSELVEITYENLGPLELEVDSRDNSVLDFTVAAKETVQIDDVFVVCYNFSGFDQMELMVDGITLGRETGHSFFDPNFVEMEAASFKGLGLRVLAGESMNLTADVNLNGWFRLDEDEKGGCKVTGMNVALVDADATKVVDLEKLNVGIDGETGTYPITYVSTYTEPVLFPDLAATDRRRKAIVYLYNEGVLEGYPDGTFGPENEINRAEFSKLLVETHMKNKGVTLEELSPDVTAGEYSCIGKYGLFIDVQEDDWFYKYVCAAKHNGWIEGYPNGTFLPTKTVNRVEALKMLLESQGIELGGTAMNVDVDDFGEVIIIVEELLDGQIREPQWYDPYINTAGSLGLVTTGKFRDNPAEPMTRAEVSEMLYNTLLYIGLLDDEDYLEFVGLVDDLREQKAEGFMLKGGSFDLRIICTEENYEKLARIGELRSGIDLNYEMYINDRFLGILAGHAFGPMHIAANSSCEDLVAGYLEAGMDINNTVGYASKAPLHIAVDNEDEEMTAFLLEAGADVNVLTAPNGIRNGLPYGEGIEWTPLHYAAVHNDLEIIELLLDNGADVNALSIDGELPVDLATAQRVIFRLKAASGIFES